MRSRCDETSGLSMGHAVASPCGPQPAGILAVVCADRSSIAASPRQLGLRAGFAVRGQGRWVASRTPVATRGRYGAGQERRLELVAKSLLATRKEGPPSGGLALVADAIQPSADTADVYTLQGSTRRCRYDAQGACAVRVGSKCVVGVVLR